MLGTSSPRDSPGIGDIESVAEGPLEASSERHPPTMAASVKSAHTSAVRVVFFAETLIDWRDRSVACTRPWAGLIGIVDGPMSALATVLRPRGGDEP